jgi:F-type H+-transporting ATPase subunit gamma
MGAQLRVYRRRIRSVQSTRKITKAMELIAASRIVKAQARMRAARPYAEELTRALEALSEDTSLKHPMLTGIEDPRRAGILVITSDRGLAGGYSANAIKCANELATRLEREGKEVSRYVIGRKATVYYRFRRIPVAGSWTGFSEQPNFADARPATEAVVNALVAAAEDNSDQPGIDELYVIYTQFKNSVTQIATAIAVSPVNAGDQAQRESAASDSDGPKPIYDFEPEAEELIAALLPRYISARIYTALLESAASESAARRRAMKSASDNASDLISDYTRLANQARQAEITQEISEIVGGADALASAGSDQR